MFCLVCALQYLSLSERAWSRCPLCFEPVYAQALKSFHFRLQQRRPALGDAVRMALIMRDKHSAQLQLSAAADDSEPPASEPTLFSRFSFTADISGICQRELMELAAAASQHRAALQSTRRPSAEECGAGDEHGDVYLQFVLMAQRAVQRRLEDWLAEHPDSSQQVRAVLARAEAVRQRQRAELEEQAAQQQRAEREEKERRRAVLVRAAAVASSPALPSRSDESVWPSLPTARPIRTLQRRTPECEPALAAEHEAAQRQQQPSVPTPAAEGAAALTDAAPDSAASLLSPAALRSEVESGGSPPLSPPPASPPSAAFPVMDPALSYLFYQAADAQPVFLHSLCYRALLLEHDSAACLPARITGRVAFIDELRMDAAQRRRMRFLSHLPLTAAFSIVALQLDDIVSAATAARFAAEWGDELLARQRQQAQRQQEARRRQRRSEQRQQQPSSSSLSPTFPSSPSSPSFQSPFAQAAYDSAVLDDDAEGGAGAVAQSASFPALPPPASAQPPLSPPPARLTAWNTIAEMGMAAAAAWAPLALHSSGNQAAAAPAHALPNAWSRSLQLHNAASPPAPAALPAASPPSRGLQQPARPH